MIPYRSYRCLFSPPPKLPLTVPCVLAGQLETWVPGPVGSALGLHMQAGESCALDMWALH